MRRLKTISLFLALALLLCLAGCGTAGQSSPAASAPASDPAPATDSAPATDPAPAEPEDASITVTDILGREISLEAPAERVVALTAANCEILYALGAGDALVGRGEYCDYPAQVMDVASVQSGYETNIEQIIALQPQILFMSTMDQPEEKMAALEDAGIKVVVADADDIEGTYEIITMIGALMGKDAEAAALIDGMKSTFEDVRAKAAGDGTETIYFEVSPLEYGLWTAGADTFMNEVANMLGLKNAFGDVSGWAEISEEQVIERNPDYIVTITMSFGEGPTPEEEIMSRKGWENVTAVKNGAILNLPDNELSRPGPRLADGAEKLYEFVFAAQKDAA